MKLFSLNFSTLVLRFYLLMAIVIGAFFIGYPILAILALPVFLMSMMAVKFTLPRLSFTKKSAANTNVTRERHKKLEQAHTAQ